MKLERRLILSFNKLQKIVNGNGKYTPRQFYQEYRHYERLNERFKKDTGTAFNPVRYLEERGNL